MSLLFVSVNVGAWIPWWAFSLKHWAWNVLHNILHHEVEQSVCGSAEKCGVGLWHWMMDRSEREVEEESPTRPSCLSETDLQANMWQPFFTHSQIKCEGVSHQFPLTLSLSFCPSLFFSTCCSSVSTQKQHQHSSELLPLLDEYKNTILNLFWSKCNCLTAYVQTKVPGPIVAWGPDFHVAPSFHLTMN